MWGAPEPAPGEVNDDLGYKKRWKSSCLLFGLDSTAPGCMAAPATEGKVGVWKEVAALGDRGTNQPQRLLPASSLPVSIWPEAASSFVWVAHSS